jgi:superfamily II DNA or RNA helicase
MLRDFQIKLDTDIDAAWNEGARNVMAVSPTGSGKTVVMGHKLKTLNIPACATAHRQELVSQISLALNREEVVHGIIAPKTVIREVIGAHMELHGRSFYNQSALIRVAGVDSLLNHDPTDRWLSQVALNVIDEGHHVLRDNKWGRAVAMFPNARGLFFTAHAERGDGRGLGRFQSDGTAGDGLVDRLVIGPCGRDLINRGYLTDYRIICPPSDIDTSDIEVGPGGELNMAKTRERVHASRTIVGDVVKHYRKFAEGELGITFAVDHAACNEIAAEFNKHGIPAAIVTAKTPIGERAQIMRKYRQRQFIQLVNVDVLGEGTDVPACTVVSMARPSASFQLVAQQFSRMLRILVSDELNRIWHGLTDEQRLYYISTSTKPAGILIDHVGNIARYGGTGRHGLPDVPRKYSLDRRERRQKKDDAIPLRVCTNEACLRTYEAVLVACPWCQTAKPAPRARTSPAVVDGDLYELDPAVLREMRGEADRIMLAPRIPNGATPAIAGAIKRNHWERQQAQASLRDAIATWAGWQSHLGRSDREAYARFFFGFGVDVATAQTLNAEKAAELEQRIRAQLSANNVVKAAS